jgi:hypothetical protein
MAYHPTPKAKTIFFSLFLFLFYFMVNKRIACVFGWRSWAGAKKLELGRGLFRLLLFCRPTLLWPPPESTTASLPTSPTCYWTNVKRRMTFFLFP